MQCAVVDYLLRVRGNMVGNGFGHRAGKWTGALKCVVCKTIYGKIVLSLV